MHGYIVASSSAPNNGGDLRAKPPAVGMRAVVTRQTVAAVPAESDGTPAVAVFVPAVA